MRVVAPGCLEGDVELLFELQLACFYKLAAEGRTAEAIRLSRSHLTPLTQDQPHLLPQVKVAPLTALSYGAILQTHFPCSNSWLVVLALSGPKGVESARSLQGPGAMFHSRAADASLSRWPCIACCMVVNEAMICKLL